MNSRERVMRAVEFAEPDRVPNGCYCLPVPPGPRADALRRLLDRHPPDFAEIHGMARALEWGPPWQRGYYVDEWGCLWRNLQDGVIGQPVAHPLAKWEDLEIYQFPDPLKGIDQIEDAISRATHERYMLSGEGTCGGVWHRLHALRGFENAMIDIAQERSEIFTLIKRLVDLNLKHLKRLVELDIDGVMFGDDWGTQQGLMVKPQHWRRCFRPAYKRMFDLVRRSGKHIFFHSDGFVMDILQDLIDIGVNAVNIQVSLIGIENLRERFGGKVCIAADVDRQHTLPFGTANEVTNLVRSIIQGFKSLNGGIILYGEIGPDVPLKNAESMLKALEKYGNLV